MAKKRKNILLRIFCISLLCFAGILLYAMNWEKISQINWEETSRKVFQGMQQETETLEGTLPVQMSGQMPILSKTAEADTSLIEVPLITQKDSGYRTGCELVSGAMLLNYYESAVSAQELYEQMDKAPQPIDASGVGANPKECFIGNPVGTSGYGCYAPALVQGMNRILNGNRYAVDITGTRLEAIEENYIKQEIPVIIWATIHMTEPGEGDNWKLADGKEFQWIAGEHCLVLIGMDEKYYYFNDPDHEGEAIGYEKELVSQRYEQLGRQAVIISR